MEIREVGQRLRAARRYRGMSQQVLADKAGLSRSFIALLENGKRQLTRRADLAALVSALEVSPSDLTGQPHPPVDVATGAEHAAIPAIREALFDTFLPLEAGGDDLTIEEAEKQVHVIMNAKRTLNDVLAMRLFPRTLRSLQLLANNPDSQSRERALKALVVLCHGGTTELKFFGYSDLAWVASERGRQAAEQLEDPLYLSLSMFTRSLARSGEGNYEEMGRLAAKAADVTPTATDEGLQVRGMHCLTMAFSAAINGDSDANVEGPLSEAREIAHRSGENAFYLTFGTTNVTQWEMALTMEQGDPELAVERADAIDPSRILTASRRVMFYADLGIAHAQAEQFGEAIKALKEAEKLSSSRLRNNALAREAVMSLLCNAPHLGRDLTGLAYRMGVAPAA